MGVASQQEFMSSPPGTLDRKGRVCVPANYRQILTAQGTIGVYVRPHPVKKILQCFGETAFREYRQNTPPKNPFATADQNDDSHDVFSQTESLAFDENGRMRLPDHLIAYAELGENINFVGLGSIFEIWDSARLRDYRERRRTAQDGAS